jgi:hypothetical protein
VGEVKVGVGVDDGVEDGIEVGVGVNVGGGAGLGTGLRVEICTGAWVCARWGVYDGVFILGFQVGVFKFRWSSRGASRGVVDVLISFLG